MTKRKHFVCSCGAETSKTAPNYYAQVKRLGFPLCSKCAITRNSAQTSLRLIKKYENTIKNADLVNHPCTGCGKKRQVKFRSVKSKYDLCKSCAAKINRLNNKIV